jgi:drug/metabolite transporter (DMT)-like permease
VNRIDEQKREHYLALLLMILASLCWGLSFISTKVILVEIPPVTIAFLRQFIAAVTLIPLIAYTHELPRITRRDLAVICSSGLFGIVLYSVLENNGLQYTTASNASMIVAALPITTLISEALFFRQKVNAKMVLCLLVSMIGVWLVVSVNGRLDLSSARFYGNLLMVGAMICWVAYTSINKQLDNSYPSIALIFYQSVASIFLFVPFVIQEAGRWPAPSDISAAVLANLIFLGVFCSALAYVFYVRAVKSLGATISAAFLNLIPVITVVAGYIVLQEDLMGEQILGMAIIMASIFALNRIMR